MKVLAGAAVEYWIDKRKREGKPIACEGNYIRIPANVLVEFQKIRNQGQKKKLSLIEQQRLWEAEHGGAA